MAQFGEIVFNCCFSILFKLEKCESKTGRHLFSLVILLFCRLVDDIIPDRYTRTKMDYGRRNVFILYILYPIVHMHVKVSITSTAL